MLWFRDCLLWFRGRRARCYRRRRLRCRLRRRLRDARSVLELIEPFVGHADQNFLQLAVFRIDGKTIVERQGNSKIQRLEGCGVRGAQAAAQRGRLLGVGLRKQDRKLIPADAERIV